MKKLYRSDKNKVIAGVCAGLGEYFNVTPKLFRVLFIIGLLFGFFPSIVVYLIFWVLLDANPIQNGSSNVDLSKVVDVDPVKKDDKID
jgi:phage shock protein C